MNRNQFIGNVGGLLLGVVLLSIVALTSYGKDAQCEKLLQEQREYYQEFILGKKSALPGDTLILIIK